MRKKAQLTKYLCSDLIGSCIAWFVFNIVRYHEVARYVGFDTLSDFLTSRRVIEGQVLIPLLWVVLFYYSGYYNKPLGKSRLSEFFVTFQPVLIGTLVLFFAALINELPKSFHVFYEQFLTLFFLTFAFVYFPRLLITSRAAKKIHSREWAIKVLILGNGQKALHTKAMLEIPAKALGYIVEGYIDTSSVCPPKEGFTENVLGDLSKVGELIKEKKIEELIVAIDTEEDSELLHLLYSLYQYKLPIKLPISYTKLLTGGMKVKTVTGVPLVDITDNNFPEGEKNIKHTLDKLVSFLVLLLLSPLYMYMAIRVKNDSPGPVFLRQERVGYLGKPFMIYKFRTMVTDAEKNGPCLSSEHDNRVTSFGRFMRKYRIDELPQFWNILKGDMSLVGPRPERKFYIDKIVKEAPYFYLLHNVRPGITSWGMVKYGYASTVKQMIERMQYDILYYENMSLLLDLKILIYTVKTVLTGKGV